MNNLDLNKLTLNEDDKNFIKGFKIIAQEKKIAELIGRGYKEALVKIMDENKVMSWNIDRVLSFLDKILLNYIEDSGGDDIFNEIATIDFEKLKECFIQNNYSRMA